MTRILFVVTGLTTGGAEIMLCNLLARIDRQRFDPVVISSIDRGTLGDRIEALGIPVYTLGLLPGSPPTSAAIWRLARLVRRTRADLVQGWMYHGNLAARLAGAFCPSEVPILWSIHHSVSSLANEKPSLRLVIRLGKHLSRRPDRIIYVSHTSKGQHESLGYCARRSCVIPNGFDLQGFAPSPHARDTLRTELGLSASDVLIGIMARYHPMKDHANFLQAAALLAPDRPEVHFVLAGTSIDQENPALQKAIRELSIHDRVHLLGERRDMPMVIGALDMLTSASAYGEAFPLVVGEAMSAGVACVVTDVGDFASLVGDTGEVVPPRDPAALAAAWAKLIDLGKPGRDILGESARERIGAKFALETVVGRYQDLYDQVLEERGNPQCA